ncbi:MAG: hypothetical protein WA790_19635 [Sulfitobacter sp.]
MPGDIEIIDFTWHDICITVSVTKNFLNTGYHHIELRADQPLPVTTTGYRSHFMLMDQFEAFETLQQLVTLWLNHAAKSEEWTKAQEEHGQLKLF